MGSSSRFYNVEQSCSSLNKHQDFKNQYVPRYLDSEILYLFAPAVTCLQNKHSGNRRKISVSVSTWPLKALELIFFFLITKATGIFFLFSFFVLKRRYLHTTWLKDVKYDKRYPAWFLGILGGCQCTSKSSTEADWEKQFTIYDIANRKKKKVTNRKNIKLKTSDLDSQGNK